MSSSGVEEPELSGAKFISATCISPLGPPYMMKALLQSNILNLTNFNCTLFLLSKEYKLVFEKRYNDNAKYAFDNRYLVQSSFNLLSN